MKKLLTTLLIFGVNTFCYSTQPAETKPEFPGGEEALRKFIADSIRLPIVNWELKCQGRVIVSFIIERDGSITDARIVRDGIGKDCDDEAIRLVQSMPNWTPATQSLYATDPKPWKPIRMMMTIPIWFRFAFEE